VYLVSFVGRPDGFSRWEGKRWISTNRGNADFHAEDAKERFCFLPFLGARSLDLGVWNLSGLCASWLVHLPPWNLLLRHPIRFIRLAMIRQTA
jgi:hypothetical protein